MANTASATDRTLVAGTRQVCLRKRHAHARKPFAVLTEASRPRRLCDPIENVLAEKLGRCELPFELRKHVEILVGEGFERFAENIERRADVNDHVLLRQLLSIECV